VSDRKYRQHGYQDRDPRSENKPQQSPHPSKDMTYGPRAIQMAPTRTISRCALCGVLLPAAVDPNGKCPQCGAALHACKQCAHFDPGSRFECKLNVPGYSKKDIENDCPKFTLSARVERETSSSASRADDPRRAFENLFKK
jgi:predicted RNA-binding Zn-ribbon protein involved in translation (DUF1610 family)